MGSTFVQSFVAGNTLSQRSSFMCHGKISFDFHELEPHSDILIMEISRHRILQLCSFMRMKSVVVEACLSCSRRNIRQVPPWQATLVPFELIFPLSTASGRTPFPVCLGTSWCIWKTSRLRQCYLVISARWLIRAFKAGRVMDSQAIIKAWH